MKLYAVEVVNSETMQVALRIDSNGKGLTEKAADKIDCGVNINLDHERYFTRVVEIVK